MPSIRYSVTVDAGTRTVTKLERVDGDDYKEIDLSTLRFDLGTPAGAGIVINIYAGGAPVSPTGGVRIDRWGRPLHILSCQASRGYIPQMS